MKILHVYKSYYPNTFGGIEKCIDTLCRHTSKMGVQNTLITTAPSPKMLYDEKTNPVTYFYPTTIEKFSCPISFSLMKDFGKIASEHDLIHFHFPWPFGDFLNLVSRSKKPYIVTYHSDIIRQKKILPFYSPLMNHFLSGAKRVVATSDNYVKSSPVLKALSANVSVVPIGLTDISVEPVETKHTEKPYFLFVGVLRQYKGLSYLIEAMRGVENFNLVIAGDGPCYEELKILISRYHLTNVVLLGHVNEERKWQLFQNAYGVVSSAHMRNEAYCYMLVEGLMFGKPLVSTEINTGTSFVNQNKVTGTVVPPTQPCALRRAMQELIENPDLAKTYGQQARAHFLSHFTAEKMTQGYMKIYEAL